MLQNTKKYIYYFLNTLFVLAICGLDYVIIKDSKRRICHSVSELLGKMKSEEMTSLKKAKLEALLQNPKLSKTQILEIKKAVISSNEEILKLHADVAAASAANGYRTAIAQASVEVANAFDVSIALGTDIVFFGIILIITLALFCVWYILLILIIETIDFFYRTFKNS